MKRFILFFIIISSISAVLFTLFNKQTVKTPVIENPKPTETPTPSKPAKTILFGDQEFAYGYFVSQSYGQMLLIPNFETPRNAETIVKDNACQNAINTGFYSKNNKPIGLWKNDDVSLGFAQANPLLNGFYSIQNGKATISYDVPTQPRLAFQTGPILINKSRPVSLAIRDDEPARRMVAGVTTDGSTLFLTLYDPLSVLRGPYLNDLPAIVDMIAKQIKIALDMGINLDGGSASAFYSNETKIWEINSVGSMLCDR